MQDLCLVKKLKLALHVVHLLGHRRVFLALGFPHANEPLDNFETLLQIVQPDENADVLATLVIRNVDLQRGLLVKLFFLNLPLLVLILEPFDEARELHHVDLSTGHLRRDQVVLFTFLDQIVLNHAEEL